MNEDFKNALHKLRDSFASDGSLAWSEKNINLSSKFDNLIFDRAGGACPVQAEGTYKGEPFYFRYRWGEASLGLGGEPVMKPEYETSFQYGGGVDGSLTLGEFIDLFNKLLIQIIKLKAGKENNVGKD
jgi:hypothetical protein